MSHDQAFISRLLKANKENPKDEIFYEMAIDMEIPHAEETKEEAEGHP